MAKMKNKSDNSVNKREKNNHSMKKRQNYSPNKLQKALDAIDGKWGDGFESKCNL